MAALLPEQGRDLPVVVGLGSVDPALVSSVLDVLSGAGRQAAADPAGRTQVTKEIPA